MTRHGVVAELAGTPLQADRHAAAILLTDAASGAVVSLDYRKRISVSCAVAQHPGGAAAHPRGYDFPGRIKAYVITDVFPLAEREL